MKGATVAGAMVTKVGVVGAGQMGNGIAQVAAVAGFDVIMVDVNPEFVENGMRSIRASLDKFVAKDKLSRADADAALGRIRASHAQLDLADRELVIEAIVENEEVKVKLWKHLDAIV